MTIQAATTLVLFLGIFNVVGGVAFGHGLRSLIHDRSPRGIFMLIWGGFFGGVPCLMAASSLLAAHTGPLFLANPILFLSATVLSMTILPELVQDLGAGPLISIGMGAAFMFVGTSVGLAMLRQGTPAGGLAGGGLFVLAGGLIFALGVGQLLRPKQS